MSLPKVGMKYEDVRNKLKNYPEAKRNMLKDSMCNQVKLHEGEQAANDLKKEVNHIGWKGGCHTNFTDMKTMSVAGGPAACNSCKHEHNRGSFGCPGCIPHNEYHTKYEKKD